MLPLGDFFNTISYSVSWISSTSGLNRTRGSMHSFFLDGSGDYAGVAGILHVLLLIRCVECRDELHRKLIAQVGAGERMFRFQQFFGRSFEHDRAALTAAFRTHIDDPIGILDDV
jgi:hypothetical protein